MSQPSKERVVHCQHCDHDFNVPDDSSEAACPQCGVLITYGRTTISVQGKDSEEVGAVALQLDAAQREADRQAAEANRLRSPWITGTFYLFVAVVIAAILLAAASIVPLWALPIVAIGSLLGVSIIGALQLRHDERLSEQSFVELMGLTLKRLPLLAGKPAKTEG